MPVSDELIKMAEDADTDAAESLLDEINAEQPDEGRIVEAAQIFGRELMAGGEITLDDLNDMLGATSEKPIVPTGEEEAKVAIPTEGEEDLDQFFGPDE